MPVTLDPIDPFEERHQDRQSGTAAKIKEENQKRALQVALRYQAVFTNGAGKELLDMWSSEVRNRKISATATLGELAYFNGLREFVEGIHQQILFAQHGGQSPIGNHNAF